MNFDPPAVSARVFEVCSVIRYCMRTKKRPANLVNRDCARKTTVRRLTARQEAPLSTRLTLRPLANLSRQEMSNLGVYTHGVRRLSRSCGVC